MKQTTENHLRFAAFVMTYKRPDQLKKTIEKLFEQTIVPEKVLIVDNDSSKEGKIVADKFSDLPVAYHSAGYNSGPAGAAKIGLQLLAEEGYNWIAWIDDDDPPVFNDTFETLLNLAKSNIHCGCVGVVGHRFNRNKGLIIRISDEELEGNGTVEVDNIAGGMCKIVNSKVVTEKNILPDNSLFYGFEELDFDLKIQQSGYVLLTDKAVYKKHRLYYNRWGVTIHRGEKKPINRLWREYYSTRNMLKILFKMKLYKALCITIIRFLIKIAAGFRFGFAYGIKNTSFIARGIFHFFINKKGKINIT